MFATTLAILGVLSAAAQARSASTVAPKYYSCISGTCELTSPLDENLSSHQSQSTCLMTCGNGSLWPYPTGVTVINQLTSSIEFDNKTVSSIKSRVLDVAISKFNRNVKLSQPSRRGGFREVKVKPLPYEIDIKVADASVVDVSLKVDESYSLRTSSTATGVKTVITAQTVFGARHALETLSQLVAWEAFEDSFVVASDVDIQNDGPQFPYRGVMLDLSRHFLPTSSIKATIDAMAYNKLNVLHLHAADTASFPIALHSLPKIPYYGAYSETDMYTIADIQELSDYANDRGVMILPELDGPSHVAAGYQWGPQDDLGDLVVCTDPEGMKKDAWASSGYEPASGQLNLANENIYSVLTNVHDELVKAFSHSSVFHVGGDEIMVGSDEASISCYNSTTKAVEILAMLEKQGLDRSNPESFYQLWKDYIGRIQSIVEASYSKAPGRSLNKLHIWGGGGYDESGVVYNMITQPDVTTVLPTEKYTIQVWDTSDDSIVPTLLKQGYEVVLSNTDYVYLDCGTFGWDRPGGYWCQPYHEWQHIYNYVEDVKSLWKSDLHGVLGSETLAWGETIGPSNLDQKLWPRSAGLAEALWGRTAANAKQTASWYKADPRMQRWSNVLRMRGIHAEPLQPQWCDQRGAYACTLSGGSPQ